MFDTIIYKCVNCSFWIIISHDSCFHFNKEWGRIRAIFGPLLFLVDSWLTRCRILRGIVWWQNKAIFQEFRWTFASNTVVHFCVINTWFIRKRIGHVCFSQIRCVELKIMSNNCQSQSLYLVKISARTV